MAYFDSARPVHLLHAFTTNAPTPAHAGAGFPGCHSVASSLHLL